MHRGKEVKNDMYSAIDMVMDKLEKQIKKNKEIAKQMQLTGFGIKFPHLSLAGNAFRNILSRDQTFRKLNKFKRFIFACTVSGFIVILRAWLRIPIKIVRKIVRTFQ